MDSFEGVIHFWFDELEPAQWWRADPALDQAIARRFSALHTRAVAEKLVCWRSEALGRLAEVIVLDQFSRNLFRGSAKAFAMDAQALKLAREAVALNVPTKLTAQQKAFLYMPYMHSESSAVQTESVALYGEPGLESSLRSALQHKAIIDRFGRYPHRNAILGRASSPEELEFLTQPGSSF
ncbi:MAG TPA: DUF924 domain-containing protein [Porticoccaceae bacterium]|nr:DUF924 domain-containing protein [Porticoccaceae bacterium]HCO60781.1 DUF924 domain-containing protein [Porticoccaceae bacterium]